LDIRAYVANVPEMDRFLGVDELNAGIEQLARDFPEITSLRRVGSSKLGEPIQMLSIGSGSKNALLFACPHPNEPIGAMLVHHLSRLLCEDDALRTGSDYTWHLIPCVDPDGTRLNEEWFAGPFSIRNYARHFYRPAGHLQVEWTFPISYKKLYFDRVLPETQMLMRVIDDLKPEFMVSLHNAGFGGVYYYISRNLPDLWDPFHQIPGWEDLPLSLGEPEVPYAPVYAPAIYGTIATADGYDYIEANGGDPARRASGASSEEYARKYGTLSLIIEVAYYDDPRVNDQTVTDTIRRDAILAGLDIGDETTETLRKLYDAVKTDLKGDSPFEAAVKWWVESLGPGREAERNWARTNPETDRPATVAELFSSSEEVQFYRLLWMGMVVRMLEGEIAIGNGTPAIRAGLVEAKRVFESWTDRLESTLDNVRVVPIRKLVAVQLGAILATAEHLRAARSTA
jgi:hypothetical protein